MKRHYIILLAAACLAFGYSLAGSFHYDDFNMFHDPVITEPSGIWKLAAPLQSRPLTYVTLWMNYQLNGQNPVGWHVFNLALHLSVCALLFTVLRKLVPPRVAFLGTLFFAVHPIQTELVAYPWERAGMLSALFTLLAILAWRKGIRWATLACFALALLAKEECLTLPFFLAMFALSENRESKRRDLQTAAWMLGLSFLAGIRTILWSVFAPGLVGTGAGLGAGVSPLQYLAVQGLAVERYLRLLVFPLGFSVDIEIVNLSTWLYIAGWLIMACLTALAIRHYRDRGPGFWFLGGLVLLIPTSSIFPAADRAADRRMYIPMIAFCVIFGLLASRWKPWCTYTAIAALTLVSIQQTRTWTTERSLWEQAMLWSPHKIRPIVNVSRAYAPQERLDLLIHAKAERPGNADIAFELGKAWFTLGQNEAGLLELQRAVDLRPTDPLMLARCGNTLMSVGYLDSARIVMRAALALDPCGKGMGLTRTNIAKLGISPPPCGKR